MQVLVVPVGLLLALACGGSPPAATGPTGSNPGASTPAAGATTPGTDVTTPTGRPSPGCAPATHGTVAPDPTVTRSMDVGGVTRSYRLTPPRRSVDEPGVPAPLVIAVHGFNSSAEDFAKVTRLPEEGPGGGAVVVMPDGAGTPKSWATSGQGPDAMFIDALLDEVAQTTCVDLDRLYMTGFSAGSAFTIAYACAHQDRIAAIATGAVDFQLGCKEPMPIIAFHGTADPAVPYDDGAIGMSLPGVEVRGTELNMGDWAKLDGCAATPTVTEVGTEVTHRVWSGCAPGTDVELYSVKGGGHTWPGADPSRGLGLTTQQVSATKELLRFFQAHPHR